MKMQNGVLYFESVGKDLERFNPCKAAGDSISVMISERGERGIEQHLNLTLDRADWAALIEAVKRHL